ncbi:Ig-like domain-containing protein [Curtobacterium sp. MCBD17_032]|uniref:Ig-like domain-containing protein n=1 Tax=Curtobacterium sp. MCBD17_032 TaxID=2175659 RepID=UPI0011B45A88|nr:Ig-like domain-containing protein [Curtobacterium sp. MCBD17_032]
MPKTTTRPSRTLCAAVLAALVAVGPLTTGMSAASAAEDAPGAVPDVPPGTRVPETRSLLSLAPPTSVQVTTSQAGFTVYADGICSFDFASCRTWFQVLAAGVDKRNVATKNGYFVPWPSDWAPGTTLTGSIRSYGVSILGFGYYSTGTTSLGDITRPYPEKDITARVASTDDSARRARITGTATPLAEIRRGGQRVATADADGNWEETVDGLPVGDSTFTYEQYVGGSRRDQTTVTVHIGQPQLPDGGVAATSSAVTEIARGTTERVPFAVRATGTITQYRTDVTLTAPEGTHFEAGQAVTGQARSGTGAAWDTDPDLALVDVRVTNSGRTLTGRFDSSAVRGYRRTEGNQQRWLAAVTADRDAPLGDGALAYALDGTTDRGTTDIRSSSPVRVVGPEVVAGPTVQGHFPADLSAWAYLDGTATPGAAVIVRRGTEEIARTTAAAGTGAFTVAIDPARVGYGAVGLSVTQVVDGAESAATPVTLDYGQNTPTFTSPLDHGTVPAGRLRFTGTGNAGGRVQVVGTDFTDDTAIGSAAVVDGAWTIESDLRLPAGDYQFWANQRTRGGKVELVGINVKVEQGRPAAPTAVGQFPDDIARWAFITGRAEPGATVIVRDAAGREVGRTPVGPSGYYTLGIDPSEVGHGTVVLTVTQEVGSVESDGIDVSLDYGDLVAPTITSPADGATVSGAKGLVIRGTALPGSTVVVTGTDQSNDALFGSTVATGGTWQVQSSIDLPAGPYQFWASQRTKGGRATLTAVNVTVTR